MSFILCSKKGIFFPCIRKNFPKWALYYGVKIYLKYYITSSLYYNKLVGIPVAILWNQSIKQNDV